MRELYFKKPPPTDPEGVFILYVVITVCFMFTAFLKRVGIRLKMFASVARQLIDTGIQNRDDARKFQIILEFVQDENQTAVRNAVQFQTVRMTVVNRHDTDKIIILVKQAVQDGTAPFLAVIGEMFGRAEPKKFFQRKRMFFVYFTDFQDIRLRLFFIMFFTAFFHEIPPRVQYAL